MKRMLCLGAVLVALVSASTLATGLVPTGDVVPGEISLTLPEAVKRGLRYNLGAVSADIGTRRASAARLAELSNLLPNLTGR